MGRSEQDDTPWRTSRALSLGFARDPQSTARRRTVAQAIDVSSNGSMAVAATTGRLMISVAEEEWSGLVVASHFAKMRRAARFCAAKMEIPMESFPGVFSLRLAEAMLLETFLQLT